VLDYGRGPEKTWVYGALRVGDGQEVTMTAPSRNSVGYQQLLTAVEAANPTGTIVVITDNLSSHTSSSTRTWLADHPRIQHTFIPKRACWLNLQEGWWRLFRRQALAGQSFATPEEITLATKIIADQVSRAGLTDILGSAGAGLYESALPPLLADPSVDAVIVIFVPAASVTAEGVGPAIDRARSGQAKPILPVPTGSGSPGPLR